jgi:hypothetical protein
VTSAEVRIQSDELVQGLLNLDFFISGELKKKVAEVVNRILAEKDSIRRVNLTERMAKALGLGQPAVAREQHATGT